MVLCRRHNILRLPELLDLHAGFVWSESSTGLSLRHYTVFSTGKMTHFYLFKKIDKYLEIQVTPFLYYLPKACLWHAGIGIFERSKMPTRQWM